MADHVYKLVEIVGTSHDGHDAAVKSALERARKSIRNIRWFEVVAQRGYVDADSSVVYQGRHGRWMPPGDDPDWRLRGTRSEGGWEVRSASDSAGWSVELKLPVEWFGDSSGRRAAIAFRIYDDAPHGWHAWPEPASGERPTVVEREPVRWADVKIE